MHRPLVYQELDVWHKFYQPYIKSNYVDAGAGCGETTYFALQHGAQKVLAIECNPGCLDNLRHNFGDDPRVTIVDFMINSIKMDIERGEKDMVMEVHFPYKLKTLSRWPFSTTSLVVLEENWGNLPRKAIRKVARGFEHLIADLAQ